MMVGGFLSLIHHKPKLRELNVDLSKYDSVIIGSPIWNDRLSTPINSVLNSLCLKDKQLTFILYSGGGKCKKAIKFINKYYPSSKIVEIKEPKNNADLALILKNNNGQFIDRFRKRFMIPIKDVRDRVIAFGGRVLDDSKPKYINSPENIVYSKGRNLFGLNVAKKNQMDIRHYFSCSTNAQTEFLLNFDAIDSSIKAFTKEMFLAMPHPPKREIRL